MATEFLPKQQLNLGGVQEHRVTNLARDLNNMMGAVASGVHTYNQIGEHAAQLEFRDTNQQINANLFELKKQSALLPEDDYQGHLDILTKVEAQKGILVSKLADFSGHTAAFDTFAQASAGTSGMLDGEYLQFQHQAIKANQLQNMGEVSRDATLGIKASPDSFQASVVSLVNSHISKDKAIEFGQKEYFDNLYSQVTQNKNSLTIPDELSVIDSKLQYATQDRVLSLVNDKLLQNSQMAKLLLVDDGKGNKVFRVDSPFSEEQNAKIVGLADYYMSLHSPKTTANSMVKFNGVKAVQTEVLGSLKPTSSSAEINTAEANVARGWNDYTKTDEFALLTPNSENQAKVYTGYAEMLNTLSKARAIHSASVNGITVAEAQNGEIKYTVTNPAKLMFPEDQNLHDSVASVSDADLKASYSPLNSQGMAAWSSGNYALARTLSNKYSALTNDKSEFDKMLVNFYTTGISSATKASDLTSLKKAVVDDYNSGKNGVSENQMISVTRSVDSALATMKTTDSALTPSALASLNNGMSEKRALTFGDSPNEQKIIKAVQTDPYFSDYKVNRMTIAETRRVLLAQGKMRPNDDPEAQGKAIIENMAEGVNKTLVPVIGKLEKDQIRKGMEEYLSSWERVNKANLRYDASNMQVSVSHNVDAYVVHAKLSDGSWKSITITPSKIREAALISQNRGIGAKIINIFK
jgi:hypothetical protein